MLGRILRLAVLIRHIVLSNLEAHYFGMNCGPCLLCFCNSWTLLVLFVFGVNKSLNSSESVVLLVLRALFSLDILKEEHYIVDFWLVSCTSVRFFKSMQFLFLSERLLVISIYKCRWASLKHHEIHFNVWESMRMPLQRSYFVLSLKFPVRDLSSTNPTVTGIGQ